MDCYVNWPMILEYLKVLLSWPPIVAVLVILIVKRFQIPITALLTRIRSLRGLGTEVQLGEAAAQQAEAAKKPAGETEDLLNQNSSDPVRARAEILRLWRLYNFERWFNVIFGTQMRLLEHLRLVGKAGEKVTELDKFYIEHQQSAGDVQSTLTNYFDFLRQTGLIEGFTDGDLPKVRLTEDGILFLAYIRQTYGVSSSNRMY